MSKRKSIISPEEIELYRKQADADHKAFMKKPDIPPDPSVFFPERKRQRQQAQTEAVQAALVSQARQAAREAASSEEFPIVSKALEWN